MGKRQKRILNKNERRILKLRYGIENSDSESKLFLTYNQITSSYEGLNPDCVKKLCAKIVKANTELKQKQKFENGLVKQKVDDGMFD